MYMATYEERNRMLEQNFTIFQKETSATIVDVKEQITMLLGVVHVQGRDIKRINERLDLLSQRQGVVDQHLAIIDGRLGVVEGRLEMMDRRLEAVEGHLETMDGRLERMEIKFDEHMVILLQVLERLPKA